MENVKILSDEINNLRKNFHIKLSKKRGLIIRTKDSVKIKCIQNDQEIQQGLERLSIIRRVIFILKTKIQ